MTVQQEAIRMINSMPDDTVGILVELLKRMMANESHAGNRPVAGGNAEPVAREEAGNSGRHVRHTG